MIREILEQAIQVARAKLSQDGDVVFNERWRLHLRAGARNRRLNHIQEETLIVNEVVAGGRGQCSLLSLILGLF